MNVSTEAKVGAVSLLGFALLAYMLIHLGNFTFGEKGYPLQAVFSQVNGLREGNVVRFAGVEVGKVKDVDVRPEGVNVLMTINPGVQIPEGSRFSIGTDGLLGEKFINIVPPPRSQGVLSPNSVVRGEEPLGLEQLISSADKVLVDVRELVRSLNDILGDEKVKAALKETAFNARDLTANLNAMSAALARMAQNNEGDVNSMVQNLKVMSGSLRDVASRVDKMVASVDNDGQTAKDLRETIQNLKTTSVRVEKMAASLEGIVTDPETAKNIKETLRNARSATEKADKMLTKVSSISVKGGYEVMYNKDAGRYSTNADVKITTSPEDFAIVGASHIGDGSKGNFQIGKGGDSFAARAGIIDSKAGVGMDTQLGSQMRMSVDVYDPNDVRVKLRTQYQVAPDTFVVGQVDSINKSEEKSTYVGVRRTF